MVAAIGQHDDDRGVDEVHADVKDGRPRRVVEPVQILEREQKRCTLGRHRRRSGLDGLGEAHGRERR